MEKYYQDLLAVECDATDGQEHDKSASEGKKDNLPEKLKKQIEKVVSCMAPGLYRSIFLIRRCCFF